jgi:hypothetical protein
MVVLKSQAIQAVLMKDEIMVMKGVEPDASDGA